MAIKLGDRVKDAYTGFEGTAVARTEWLHSCIRITIEPTTLDKEGKVKDSQTFDEQRVQLVKAAKPINLVPNAKNGGPRDEPARRRDPVGR